MRTSLKETSVLLIVLVALFISRGAAFAQSGRAEMNGYVAFDGLAYVDKQPRAKVELMTTGPNGTMVAAATVETDEHGQYAFKQAPLGEFVLRITAAGYKTYEASIYLPSDFIGNLATMMKKEDAKPPVEPKK